MGCNVDMAALASVATQADNLQERLITLNRGLRISETFPDIVSIAINNKLTHLFSQIFLGRRREPVIHDIILYRRIFGTAIDSDIGIASTPRLGKLEVCGKIPVLVKSFSVAILTRHA